MKTKNLGLRKSCIFCKKTLLVDINIKGEGSLGLKCAHCKKLVKVEITPKTQVLCL